MKFENLRKLLTKEDPFMLHKTLGFTCLVHFIYRYYLLFRYGDMDLNNNTAAILVGLHGLLSASSFIFRVPHKQNPTAPMIYQEFRAHSVLFAWRSVLSYYCMFFNLPIYARMAVCLLTSYAADVVSSYLKCNTTIRDLTFQKSMTLPEVAEIKAHYSRMQVGATMYMLGNLDTAFSPLYAIQIAAFFMTLVRKNIVKTRALNATYGTALWINAFCFWSVKPGWYLLWVVAGNSFIYMRFTLHMDKYVAWCLAFGVFILLQDYVQLAETLNGLLDQYGLMRLACNLAIATYIGKNLWYFGCIFRPDTPATLAAADKAAVQREQEEAAEEREEEMERLHGAGAGAVAVAPTAEPKESQESKDSKQLTDNEGRLRKRLSAKSS